MNIFYFISVLTKPRKTFTDKNIRNPRSSQGVKKKKLLKRNYILFRFFLFVC